MMNIDSGFDYELPPEVVKIYISRRYNDLNECRAALEANDFTKIAHLAHQMKGNGASFGFEKITEIGGVLEMAAKNEDSSTVKTYLQELNYFLDQTN